MKGKFILIVKLLRQNLLSGLLIFVLALFLLELGLRLMQPTSFEYYRNLKEFHVYSPDYLVGLAPHADTFLKDNKGLWSGRFTTNSLGMRGSREINKKQKQVACLGDSMIMGFGVSDKETMCSLLDNSVIAGHKIQTLNVSIDALGSRGYAKRLKQVSEHTKLDIVLLFVSPNDFVMPENLRKRGIISDDQKDKIRFNNPTELMVFKYRFLLTQYSYLAHASAVSIKQLAIRTQLLFFDIDKEIMYAGLKEYNPIKHGPLNTTPGPLHYIKNAFYKKPVRKTCDSKPKHINTPPRQCPEPVPAFARCQLKETPRKKLKPLYPITQKYYKEMIVLSKEKNFLLVPVFLPIQDQNLYCSQAGLYSPLFDFALRAKYFFEDKGVKTIDLRKYVSTMCNRKFQNISQYLKIGDYYIHGDGHYTVEGNRWAAEVMYKELQKIPNVF